MLHELDEPSSTSVFLGLDQNIVVESGPSQINPKIGGLWLAHMMIIHAYGNVYSLEASLKFVDVDKTRPLVGAIGWKHEIKSHKMCG